MRIEINGIATEVCAASLAAILLELGYAGAVVATALNGEFVPRDARAGTLPAEGDRIEIIAPMQGG